MARVLPLICWALLIAGCATTSTESGGAGDARSNEESPGQFWCKASCDPEKALLALRKQHPSARFFIEKAVPGVFTGGDLPELKFETREQLQDGLKAPHGTTVAVVCIIEGREVWVRVSHRMIDCKVGPYLYHIRGKPRESATAYVEGTRALHEITRASSPTWYIHFGTLGVEEAATICKHLEISQIEVSDVSVSGKATLRGPAKIDALDKVARPAMGKYSFGAGTDVEFLFLEGDSDVAVSIETPDSVFFLSLIEKIEAPSAK